jgi:hypothetical protein
VTEAERFRAKAAEVRQHAGLITDPEIRTSFLEIAEEHENLARQAERLARREQ